MANVNAPRGFSPVSTLNGASWNQAGRLYAVPTADTTHSFAIGDVVMSLASSDTNGIPYVQRWAGATTTSALPLGIIVGVQIADPVPSLQASNLDLTQTYINPGTRTNVRYIYVVDDPNVIFTAQFDSTAIVSGDLHKNSDVSVTTTVTYTSSAPFSTMVLTAPAVTASLPIRLMGAYQIANNAVGAYVRVLCKWNFHEYGVTAGASGTVPGYLAA